MPHLPAQKAVRPAAHFLAAVERALVLDPVEVVAHDGGVVRPPFLGRADLVVAIQESEPIAVAISARDADQFGTEPRDDETKAVLFVGQNIKKAVAPLYLRDG